MQIKDLMAILVRVVPSEIKELTTVHTYHIKSNKHRPRESGTQHNENKGYSFKNLLKLSHQYQDLLHFVSPIP
jgi:hypothetical protein